MSVFGDISKHHTLSGPNNNTVTKSGVSASNDSSYGKRIIACDCNEIIEYQIKILNTHSGYIGVGIVSNLHHQTTNKGFNSGAQDAFYYIQMHNGDVIADGKKKDNLCHQCVQGDILSLIIDMKQHKLFTKKNSNENDIKLCANIKTKPNLTYRFALRMYYKNSSVSVSLKDSNNNSSEKEEKNNQILLAQIKEDNEVDKMKGIILSLKDETKRLNAVNVKQTIQINKYEQQTKDQKTFIDSMKKGNDKQINEYKTQIEEQKTIIQSLNQEKIAVEKNNNEKTTQIAAITHLVNKLKSECESLKDRINIFENEQKEYEINILKLKEENKKLKLSNINTNNYEQWTVDEIIYWVISLNPQIYGKYEQILYKSLTEEEVNGECINDIDVSDIKRWGILNFKHSKTLMKHIQLLIQNNQKNENNQNQMNKQIYNEGVNAPTAYM